MSNLIKSCFYNAFNQLIYGWSMVFDSLLDYIDSLESIGKLHRVKTEVDTNLEIAEIMRRMMYTVNSPAILFENVKGYDIPILGNAFGTIDLLKTALNIQDF